MTATPVSRAAGLALALCVITCANAASAAPFMIVGLDEKTTWNDKGERVVSPPGRDSVLILDLARPEHPRTVAKLPLENSVAGPPVNVAISPDGATALVADSYTVVQQDGQSRLIPTDKLFVIDLKATPARLVQTLNIGKQPSGLSFNARGDLALVAYRGANGVGVLKVEHGRVREIGRVDLGDSISHVVFTPDGRRALAVKHEAGKVALLHVDGDRVIYDKLDLPGGKQPYTVDVDPDGRLAAVTTAEGLTVLDLSTEPARVADGATAAPGMEGLAFSPNGKLAVATAISGSNGDKASPRYHPHGLALVFRVDGARLTPVKQIAVGGAPEAVCFTPDGRYVYVGDFLDQEFAVLRVDGLDVTDTGERFKTPGHPASARMGP